MRNRKQLAAKIKVGSFVKVKETAYRHIEYEGVVTESFPEMIQIFGCGYEPLGFHEFDVEKVKCVDISKEKVNFTIEQAIREIEAKKLNAEIKMRDLQSRYDEMKFEKERLLK